MSLTGRAYEWRKVGQFTLSLSLQAGLALALVFLLLLFALAACSSNARSRQETTAGARIAAGGPVRAVATTTIVGDVVANVGGEAVDLTVLLPPGVDPHGFDPAPADIATVAAADVVFVNGFGLEEFLTSLIENAGGNARVVAVSDGIEPIELAGQRVNDTHDGKQGREANMDVDPHTWTDPNNVLIWVRNIEQALRELDPAHAESYATNAGAYEEELVALDTWVRQQVAQIPEPERRLVTDHLVFGYFAARYGFEQVATFIPGYSTLAAPSARDLAEIEDVIRSLNVRAVFVGNTFASSVAQRIAGDTGTRLVPLYTGSLSDENGDAPTYLDYVRYNVGAIVAALR